MVSSRKDRFCHFFTDSMMTIILPVHSMRHFNHQVESRIHTLHYTAQCTTRQCTETETTQRTQCNLIPLQTCPVLPLPITLGSSAQYMMQGNMLPSLSTYHLCISYISYSDSTTMCTMHSSECTVDSGQSLIPNAALGLVAVCPLLGKEPPVKYHHH